MANPTALIPSSPLPQRQLPPAWPDAGSAPPEDPKIPRKRTTCDQAQVLGCWVRALKNRKMWIGSVREHLRIHYNSPKAKVVISCQLSYGLFQHGKAWFLWIHPSIPSKTEHLSAALAPPSETMPSSRPRTSAPAGPRPGPSSVEPGADGGDGRCKICLGESGDKTGTKQEQVHHNITNERSMKGGTSEKFFQGVIMMYHDLLVL